MKGRGKGGDAEGIAPGDRLLVISPHLDDGVFGCGRLLAAVPDAVVATLFAGRPAPGEALTDWDSAAGFSVGDDVLAVRREEDRLALAHLGARPLWLDFPDAQYGPPPSVGAVTAALREALVAYRPQIVLFPLGLFHSDHVLGHEAALALLDEGAAGRWFAYEDAYYRRLPGLLDERIAALRAAGRTPLRVHMVVSDSAAAAERKRRAVACYRSQLRALAACGWAGHADLDAEEGFWRVGCAAVGALA